MALTKREDFPTLDGYRDSLYRRLELGYARIERGLAEGQDVAAWEDFWCELFKDYERVCTELTADLAAGEVREDWSKARADRLPGVR